MALRSCKWKAHNVDGSSVEIEMEEIGAGCPKVSWCVGFFTDRHQCACQVGKLATVIASEMYGGESDVLESNESDASLSSIDASEGDEDNDDEEYFTTRHYTSNRPSHTAQQALSSSQPSSSTNKENEVCCVMLCLLFV